MNKYILLLCLFSFCVALCILCISFFVDTTFFPSSWLWLIHISSLIFVLYVKERLLNKNSKKDNRLDKSLLFLFFWTLLYLLFIISWWDNGMLLITYSLIIWRYFRFDINYYILMSLYCLIHVPFLLWMEASVFVDQRNVYAYYFLIVVVVISFVQEKQNINNPYLSS